MERGVAVIGLGCVFPGAPDVASYWRNIKGGVDCVSEASDARWDGEFYDPNSKAVDRVYSRRGGFLPDVMPFEAGRFGIMPVAAEGAEPDQLLALKVAADALDDAGLDRESLANQRVGVILGRGGYLTPGLVRLNRKVREAGQLASILRELAPGLDPAVVETIKARFQDEAGAYGPDTAIGLVPNLAASRIANRLDLNGPAYTVDAACASALIAVEHAVRELRDGRCDVVIAGGVHVSPDITFWSVFAQLGALSRSGTLAAFDQGADGLVIGEGIGMLALKRLDRAEADGDKIYAVLRGVGSASDGRAASVMVPRVAGQVLALERAWQDAGVDRDALGLVEAHGTGTNAGDRAELRTLTEVFGEGPEAVLGSVKTMIGHTMPAAGAAGLIKAVLAVHHGVLPPSLHCDNPRAELEATRFSVIGKAKPWSSPQRVAAVNAFGFGGINAHVVLEGHGDAVAVPRALKPIDAADALVLRLAAATPEALLVALDAGRSGGEGPCRLAVVDPTPKRIARARKAVVRGEAWRGRGAIWFSPSGLVSAGGKVAWMFPGIEAQFAPEVASVAEHFGLEPPVHTAPTDLEQTGRGVVELGRFLDAALRRLGCAPDLVLGHSIGEWSGMMATGMLSNAEVDAFLEAAGPGTLEVPGVLFAAAGCGVGQAREAIAGLEDIAISHDNCLHQVILCGEQDSVSVARERLIDAGVICQVLPFKSGFHSALFADYVEPHRKHFADFDLKPAALPLWSATTVERYPDAPDAIRDLVIRHLVEPLRYTELVQRLFAEGARVFVQVGTGSLTGFVDDTLAGEPHLAVSANEPRRSGLAQLRNLALALWVEGADVEVDALVPKRGPTVDLALGAPLLTLGPDLRGRLSASTAVATTDDSPVMSAFGDALSALSRSGADVLEAYRERSAPKRWSGSRTLSVHTDPALWDHSFFPQPPGWSTPSDGHPVVPMTMTIELLLDAARQLVPGWVVVEATELQAFKWLVVEPEITVELVAERDGDWVRASITDYAEIRLRMAPAFPAAPAPAFDALPSPRSTPVDAVQLYQERWMFHGPRYQGITTLGPMDDSGIEGIITAPEGLGSLLDNAGQILGYWLMAAEDLDQLAMPVGMDLIEWFEDHPPIGAEVLCRVRILGVDDSSLAADLELVYEGRLWCRIRNWVDHRFETDPHVWAVMRQPEHHMLSVDRGAYRIFDESAHRAPSRDWLMRRYLGESERAAMLASGPRGQRRFLDDRIAAKDAVRFRLHADGVPPLFPVEVPLGPDLDTPVLGGPLAATGWQVAVAHDAGVSVARASDGSGAIALVPVETVDEGFVSAGDLSFFDGAPDAAARVQAAKTVAAQRRGADPRSLLAIEGGDADHLVVDGISVKLVREGAHIVAWSET
ncbi:MAG: polyketide synthase dehydratase domain-containing protein [Proteobacteria bacterium]|nr:polyketide synthase dehydratase domain-containing protein [Pseudomonadota bacterium]